MLLLSYLHFEVVCSLMRDDEEAVEVVMLLLLLCVRVCQLTCDHWCVTMLPPPLWWWW